MSQLTRTGMPKATKVFRGPLNWAISFYTYILGRNFKTIGKGCSFHPMLNINHPEKIIIGDDVIIGSFSWIGAYGEKDRPVGELIIGNRVHIGSYSTIIAKTKIKIGNNVLLSQRVVILDNIHEYKDVDKAVIDQPISSGGEIIIEDDCFIGVNSVILQKVKIGKHTIIGANSVVTRDVPPYSVVAGSPAKVIKQYDFKKKQWFSVK
jgi:acetyltransferase-like isoleucine patch superfamily enzyme